MTKRKIFVVTAIIIAALDSLLLCVGTQVRPNWWLAIPVLLLNIPALPLAILYSIFLPDAPRYPMLATLALFGSEIVVTAWVWGWVWASMVVRRRIRLEDSF